MLSKQYWAHSSLESRARPQAHTWLDKTRNGQGQGFTLYYRFKSLSTFQIIIMSSSTYSSQAFKPATSVSGNLLSELFAATPLYIFAMALKTSLQRAGRR